MRDKPIVFEVKDHSLPSPFQLNQVETTLHIAAAKNTGFPLSSASSQRAVLLGGERCQCFSSCPQLPAAEAKSQVSADSLHLSICFSWNGCSTLDAAC